MLLLSNYPTPVIFWQASPAPGQASFLSAISKEFKTVHHLQKDLLDSTFSTLIQIRDYTEKLLLSCFHHRPEFKHKYLLNYLVARNRFNKHLLSGSIRKILGYEFNTPKNSRSSETNWTPLIKITCSPTSEASSTVCKLNHHTCDKIQINSKTNCSAFLEKYILCIGGRGRLYPEYRCLIESLGGSLLIYRGNQKGDSDRLPDLLTCADLIICPVDCVHHETYFAVKFYCKKSGKPCAFLERSDLPTFRKGVKILTSVST